MNEATITVRKVKNTTTGEIWFEEKLDNGQWAEVDGTRMKCEGNARHGLAAFVERRRQQRLAVYHSYGNEEQIPIG